MVNLNYVSVIPLSPAFSDKPDEDILTDYYNTLLQLKKMNMESEIYKCVLISWIEDAFFG